MSCASDIRITCFTCVFVRCCTSLMSDSTLLLVAFVWPVSTPTTTSNGDVHSKRSKMSALMVVTGPAMATKTTVRVGMGMETSSVDMFPGVST